MEFEQFCDLVFKKLCHIFAPPVYPEIVVPEKKKRGRPKKEKKS